MYSYDRKNPSLRIHESGFGFKESELNILHLPAGDTNKGYYISSYNMVKVKEKNS